MAENYQEDGIGRVLLVSMMLNNGHSINILCKNYFEPSNNHFRLTATGIWYILVFEFGDF